MSETKATVNWNIKKIAFVHELIIAKFQAYPWTKMDKHWASKILRKFRLIREFILLRVSGKINVFTGKLIVGQREKLTKLLQICIQ